MKEILDAMLAALARGERVVLCSIFASSGSSPRGAGAKMAVLEDGSTLGTVGGGAVELLCAEGLLQRTPDGTDRRMVHLSITPEGRPLARECQGLQEHCGARLLDGLSPEQVCQLRELLETVLDNGARLAEEAFQ